MRLPFRDRDEAGRVLAEKLANVPRGHGLLVLALPRGGVPVGYQVARLLAAPLDVFVVRKLGVPGQEELAAGAIASGGVVVFNPEVAPHVDPGALKRTVLREQAELERREREYRPGRPPLAIQGRHVILVDDGLATGASMRAAALAVRASNPTRLTLAAPVASTEACDELARVADEMVCAATPEPFMGVGMWYQDFHAVSDDEVREVLNRATTVPARGGDAR
jgi:putative phosphoribosyl transferase